MKGTMKGTVKENLVTNSLYKKLPNTNRRIDYNAVTRVKPCYPGKKTKVRGSILVLRGVGVGAAHQCCGYPGSYKPSVKTLISHALRYFHFQWIEPPSTYQLNLIFFFSWLFVRSGSVQFDPDPGKWYRSAGPEHWKHTYRTWPTLICWQAGEHGEQSWLEGQQVRQVPDAQ